MTYATCWPIKQSRNEAWPPDVDEKQLRAKRQIAEKISQDYTPVFPVINMSEMRAMLATLLLCFTLGVVLESAAGCMCMPSHPQEEICRNDSFVALVRIKGEMIVRVPFPQQQQQQDRHKKSAGKPASMILTVKGRGKKDKKTKDSTNNEDFVPTAQPGEVIMNDVTGGEDRFSSLVRYRIKVHKAYKGFSAKGSNKQKLYIYSALDEGLCGRRLKTRDTYLIIGSIVEGRLRVDLCNHVIPWMSLPKNEKRNVRRNMEQTSKVCDAECEVNYCPWSNCKPESANECSWNKSMERKYGDKVHQANFVCLPNSRGRCSWQRSATSKQTKRTRRHNEGLRRRLSPQLP